MDVKKISNNNPNKAFGANVIIEKGVKEFIEQSVVSPFLNYNRKLAVDKFSRSEMEEGLNRLLEYFPALTKKIKGTFRLGLDLGLRLSSEEKAEFIKNSPDLLPAFCKMLIKYDENNFHFSNPIDFSPLTLISSQKDPKKVVNMIVKNIQSLSGQKLYKLKSSIAD